MSFLSKENLGMVWEVILEENIVIQNSNQIEKIFALFNQVSLKFYEREKNNYFDVFSLNKKFITIIISVLQKNFAPIKQPLRATEKQDIQNNRASQFEQQLSQKQHEFSSAMALPIPETPNFSDNAKDSPISEMEMMVKQTIAQRNLDLEKLNANLSKKDAENWIKSSETSVRAEKTRDGFKQIKIHNDSEQNVDVVILPDKHVTWGENKIHTSSSTSSDIFSRLKKISNEDQERNTLLEMQSQIIEMNLKINDIYKLIKDIAGTIENKIENETEK